MVILPTHLQDCQSKMVVLTTLAFLCMSSCVVFLSMEGESYNAYGPAVLQMCL